MLACLKEVMWLLSWSLLRKQEVGNTDCCAYILPKPYEGQKKHGVLRVWW